MDCSRIREELVAYLDGELGGSRAADVRKHIEQCPACKLRSQQLAAVGAALDEVGEIEPAKDFTVRVMQKALSAPALPAVSRLKIIRRLVPVAAAAAVILVLTLWLVAPEGPPSVENLSPVEKEIVENMEILENLELLENMEILSELDLLLEYDEEDFESS
jgi:anti-sigma factor RsiW